MFSRASGASFGYLEEECQRSFERRCSAVDGEPEGKRSFSPTGRQRLGRGGDRGNPVQNNEPAPPAKDGPEVTVTGYGGSSLERREIAESWNNQPLGCFTELGRPRAVRGGIRGQSA
jgi:hypothetical protein